MSSLPQSDPTFLADVTVLELPDLRTDFLAGSYSGRVLSDLGARVLRLETPRSWASRNPEEDPAYVYTMSGKEIVTLDLTQERGRTLFSDLLEWVDVVIDPGLEFEIPELCYESFSRDHPRLIWLSITPFGRSGEKRDYRTYHLNRFHASGEGFFLPGVDQSPDRPPVKAGWFVGDFEAGAGGAAAVISALIARLSCDRGQLVELSQQEFGINLNRYFIMRYPNEGINEDRFSQEYRYGGVFPCEDAYILLVTLEEHQWEGVKELLGHPDWTTDPRFKNSFSRSQHGEELNEKLREWIKDHTAREIYHRAQKNGVPVGVVHSPRDLLEWDHLLDVRDFFQTDESVNGEVLIPMLPYRFANTSSDLKLKDRSLTPVEKKVYRDWLGLAPKQWNQLKDEGVI